MSLFLFSLQIVDVLSDVGLLQELSVEQWCSEPALVVASAASLGIAAIVNIIGSAVVMWRVRSRSRWTTQFFQDYQVQLSILSILCLAGVSIVELLISDLFGMELFSLFKDSEKNRAWLKRQIQYTGLP